MLRQLAIAALIAAGPVWAQNPDWRVMPSGEPGQVLQMGADGKFHWVDMPPCQDGVIVIHQSDGSTLTLPCVSDTFRKKDNAR